MLHNLQSVTNQPCTIPSDYSCFCSNNQLVLVSVSINCGIPFLSHSVPHFTLPSPRCLSFPPFWTITELPTLTPRDHHYRNPIKTEARINPWNILSASPCNIISLTVSLNRRYHLPLSPNPIQQILIQRKTNEWPQQHYKIFPYPDTHLPPRLSNQPQTTQPNYLTHPTWTERHNITNIIIISNSYHSHHTNYWPVIIVHYSSAIRTR